MSSNPVEISSERVDDIPVIVEWLKQMEIAKWIDQKLSQPHGNHQGLSYGQLSVLLLIYIIDGNQVLWEEIRDLLPVVVSLVLNSFSFCLSRMDGSAESVFARSCERH